MPRRNWQLLNFFFFFRNLEPLIRCVAIFHFSKICRQFFVLFWYKNDETFAFFVIRKFNPRLVCLKLFNYQTLPLQQPTLLVVPRKQRGRCLHIHRWSPLITSNVEPVTLNRLKVEPRCRSKRPNVNELDKNHRNVNKIPEVA